MTFSDIYMVITDVNTTGALSEKITKNDPQRDQKALKMEARGAKMEPKVPLGCLLGCFGDDFGSLKVRFGEYTVVDVGRGW